MQQPFTWEEYTFHLEPMTGHTRFSTLIGFEADGIRLAHTGDQYFFLQDLAQASPTATDNQMQHNYVYRNGSLLDAYQNSGRWLQQW